MRTAANRGHHSGENTRSFCVYTVYNNKTDYPVIVDGNVRECAKAMGISELSFYYTVHRVKAGKNRKWTILKNYLDELEED